MLYQKPQVPDTYIIKFQLTNSIRFTPKCIYAFNKFSIFIQKNKPINIYNFIIIYLKLFYIIPVTSILYRIFIYILYFISNMLSFLYHKQQVPGTYIIKFQLTNFIRFKLKFIYLFNKFSTFIQ